MSVYSPSWGPNPYRASAMRFHLARECTISISPFTSIASKCTGRSTPFRLSFKPELFSTNSGADTRSSPMASEKTFSKVSFTYLMASSVSRTLSTLLYPWGIIHLSIDFSSFGRYNRCRAF